MRLYANCFLSGEKEHQPPRGSGSCSGRPPLIDTVYSWPTKSFHEAARERKTIVLSSRQVMHDVVRPHAVGDVVAIQRGRVGEPLGHATLRRHQVDLGVAVVLAGEGEPFAVGREAGKHLEAGIAGQLAGDAARSRHAVEIAGVGEHYLLAVDSREPQQPRLLCPAYA